MRFLLALAALIIGAASAFACDLSLDECWPGGRVKRSPEVRGWVRQVKPAPRVIVKEIIVRPDRERDRHDDAICAPHLAEPGDQFVTEDGAKREADKAWAQVVRARFGERMMDLQNARDVHYACWRSSVGSVAGQVLHRCEVYAKPCQAPRIRVEK